MTRSSAWAALRCAALLWVVCRGERAAPALRHSCAGLTASPPLPAALFSLPCSYQGGRTLDDFLKFINEKVSADAGFARVDALVPLAQVRRGAGRGGGQGRRHCGV